MTFTVHTKRADHFALNVRVPEWATQPAKISVNGQRMDIASTPGTFLKISRKWHDGDKVTVTLPMSLRFEPVDAQNPNLAALMYGPIMLVAMADREVNFTQNEAHPEKWIHLQDPATLTFSTEDGQLFRPFYLVTNESYTTYCSFPPTAVASK
jgi:DUF1680 family protein